MERHPKAAAGYIAFILYSVAFLACKFQFDICSCAMKVNLCISLPFRRMFDLPRHPFIRRRVNLVHFQHRFRTVETGLDCGYRETLAVHIIEHFLELFLS